MTVESWNKSKINLCDDNNHDYTFTILQENLLKVLQSVIVEMIRKWEHCMWCWLDVYDGGIGAHEAQLHIQKFSL